MSDCFLVEMCTFAVHFGEDPRGWNWLPHWSFKQMDWN